MNPPPPPPEQGTPLAAIVMMICAGLFFSMLDTTAKYLVLAGSNPQFVAWARFVVHLLLVLILFRSWANPAVFRYQSLWRQILRGAFLVGSTVFNFHALKSLQLAESMSIYFLAPMAITALAGPLLGERVGWRRWMAVGAGFIGMLFITRPGFGVFGMGHVLALGSMLSYVFYALMTRSMGARESSESLIFYAALSPAVLMLPAATAIGDMPPSALLWAMLLALGVFGGVGHYLLIGAYKQATATALAPYPYLQMVWMVIAGYVVFGDLPDGWTLFGAAIIVASGLYIVNREHRLRLADRTAPTAEARHLAKKL